MMTAFKKLGFVITPFKIQILIVFLFLFTAASVRAEGVLAQAIPSSGPPVQVTLPFQIPTMSDLLTFLIRFFFAVAGLVALVYLMLGSISWITSGGNKENVEKAREKIQAAIIGVILIVLVLAIIWTIEQVVFAAKICFGISCPLTIPTLIRPN